MPGTWQSLPKLWRVRGKAPDGLIVTLGRYDTEEEARADCAKLTREAVYRNLVVQAIEPAAPAAPEAAKPASKPTHKA